MTVLSAFIMIRSINSTLVLWEQTARETFIQSSFPGPHLLGQSVQGPVAGLEQGSGGAGVLAGGLAPENHPGTGQTRSVEHLNARGWKVTPLTEQYKEIDCWSHKLHTNFRACFCDGVTLL